MLGGGGGNAVDRVFWTHPVAVLAELLDIDHLVRRTEPVGVGIGDVFRQQAGGEGATEVAHADQPGGELRILQILGGVILGRIVPIAILVRIVP